VSYKVGPDSLKECQLTLKTLANVSTDRHAAQFKRYLKTESVNPLFLCGDSASILSKLPDQSVDFCMTSPPYWGQRQYDAKGIGLEDNPTSYADSLCLVFQQLHRVLKDSGSFWLNIGDAYLKKKLLGLPWRIAFRLIDEQGWVLRNDVIWNKVKGGPDNAKDKLGNVHEYVFHFVKHTKGYYYDADAIRSNPGTSKVVNGAIVSATGVTGVRYKRQIELSTVLSDDEKADAQRALNDMLAQVAENKIADFRMIIRGQQRTTHSDSQKVSGRAREIAARGYYFLKYHPKGSKPRDVWEIIPEDSQRRKSHFAPYPEDLCRIPLLATCPHDGVALDPFCGTGTTMLVARNLVRKSVGIDISTDYLENASERCVTLF